MGRQLAIRGDQLVLTVVVAGLGYYLYQERQKDGTLSIEIGKDGVSVKKE